VAEPSLSEITNLKVDPELGTGNTGYVVDNRDLVRNIIQAGQFKAQNDWKKYNLFLEDHKEKLKNAEEIASMPVAPQDRERLEKESINFLNNMANNPKDYFSQMGSAKGKEQEQQYLQWKKDATASKQDYLWDLENRKFLQQNPDHDTPENRAKIEGFLTNQKLGGRQPYILDMPGTYDPNALAKELNTAVEQKVAQPGMTPDGKFTYTETGTKYNPDQYRKVASSIFDLNQKGFQNTIGNLFSKLPASEQVKYKDSQNPVKDWFLDFQDTFRKPDQVTKDDLKANPFALETQRAKTEFALEDLRNRDTTGREIKLAELRNTLSDAPKPEQTKFLLNLASSVVGNTTGQTLTVDTGKGAYSTEKVVDASPVIKKLFSKPIKTSTKDASGKDVTTENALEPDVITRTADGGLRTIFYKKTPKGATVTSGGKPVEESAEIVPLPEVMSILGKDYMEKKDLPGAVNLAGDVLKQYGGDISKYAQAANPAPAKPAVPAGQPQTRTGKDGKTYTSTDGITWTAPDGTTVTLKKK
jgi:hypothetical protein